MTPTPASEPSADGTAPHAAAASAELALRLQGISKRFGTLLANDDISLTLARGEVLALLGENGAGKSTLVSILFGHYRADAGNIEVFGRPLASADPAAALAAGVGMVHQHFTLADNLSVLDNVLIGTEPLLRLKSARHAARGRLLDLAQRFGLSVDADARVVRLSVGERQRVEILKALFRGARILILDEPTAVLTPQESAALFATLRQLIAQGLSVIFISHKLDEVLAVADRVAVLRAGRLVHQVACANTSKAALAEAMVGRVLAMPSRGNAALETAAAGKPQPAYGAPTILMLNEVAVSASNDAALHEVSLQVSGGEIVAIAGVAGNGQGALARLLFGQAQPQRGTVSLHGQPYPRSAAAAVAAGIARVPEDRRAHGSVGELSLLENAALERLGDAAFATTLGFLRQRPLRAYVQHLMQTFDVRGGTAATPARLLSGGNLQKLILGRALMGAPADHNHPTGRPRLIVVDQPTWGLDVGAVADIHARLLAAREAGDAVLLISEDLDEIFALADRVAVLNHGRLVETRPTADWTLAELGLAMGERRTDAQSLAQLARPVPVADRSAA